MRKASMLSWEHIWYQPSFLSILLLPVAGVFAILAAARAAAYRIGLKKIHVMPVPVIVVGNISAGGTGKTPLVLWLSEFLREQGFAPGIISRGYGGIGATRAVTENTDPAIAGDEPVMLAQRSRCPVWIGHSRAAAAAGLLQTHPDCNVLISDDGLQHLGLARDLEIAVVDGARGLGNGRRLPAGPLREAADRLAKVDAVVVNGELTARLPGAPRPLHMTLDGGECVNLLNPQFRAAASGFAGKQIHAIAAIGNPGRFFAHLQRLGLSFVGHPFPDHHAFVPSDLAFEDADAVIMTEKDAIKCRRFALETHWYLPVEASVDPELGRIVLHKLKARHGSKTA